MKKSTLDENWNYLYSLQEFQLTTLAVKTTLELTLSPDNTGENTVLCTNMAKYLLQDTGMYRGRRSESCKENYGEFI